MYINKNIHIYVYLYISMRVYIYVYIYIYIYRHISLTFMKVALDISYSSTRINPLDRPGIARMLLLGSGHRLTYKGLGSIWKYTHIAISYTYTWYIYPFIDMNIYICIYTTIQSHKHSNIYTTYIRIHTFSPVLLYSKLLRFDQLTSNQKNDRRINIHRYEDFHICIRIYNHIIYTNIYTTYIRIYILNNPFVFKTVEIWSIDFNTYLYTYKCICKYIHSYMNIHTYKSINLHLYSYIYLPVLLYSKLLRFDQLTSNQKNDIRIFWCPKLQQLDPSCIYMYAYIYVYVYIYVGIYK
jgi:hypothetical protein